MSKNESTAVARPPADVAPITEMPDDLVEVLVGAGIEPAGVHTPSVRFAMPIAKDDLLVYRKDDLKAEISDVMVVARVQEFPEADLFAGYKGYIRAEAFLRSGEYVAWTTHLFNKSTGELGPIAEYLRNVPTPAAIRLGKFESKSHPGQFVYRPIPLGGL